MNRNVVDTVPEGVDLNDLDMFIVPGKGLGKSMRRNLSDEEYHVVQTYLLCNCAEVEPYIE